MDQRRFDRVPAGFGLESECRSDQMPANTWSSIAVVDLSAGGLRFHSRESLGLGELIDVRIRLPNLAKPLALRARVVRRGSPGPGGRECAAEYLDVTPDQRAEIDELVQFLRTRPPSP